MGLTDRVIAFTGFINVSVERQPQPLTSDVRRPSNIDTLSRPGEVDSSKRRLQNSDDDVTDTLPIDFVLPSPTNRRRGTRSMVSTLAAVVQTRPSMTPIAASLLAAPTPGAILFPVTFRTSESCAITKLKIYSTFSIHMKVRTLQPDAVLLYISSGGHVERDFLAIELVVGRPRYVFDTGSGPRHIAAPLSSAPVNDGRWHDVGIVRSDLTDERRHWLVDLTVVDLTDERGHWLVVDGLNSYDQLQAGPSRQRHSVHFDLNDDLFIGGVPRLMHRQAARASLKSRNGLQGCLASLVLNGQIRNIADLSSFDIPEDSVGHVIAGCDGPSDECGQSRVCQNEGECVQQWVSFACICDMTSFSGNTCAEESIAYTFGHHGGTIVYSFPDHELPDTRVDQLAFGLVTTQRVAVLLRVVSGSSSDFIELELVDGNVLVVYNVGLTDHVISDPYVKVNDGKYHVVRFTRSGANATLRIDDLPQQIKVPTGQQRTTFNHQSKLYIGGKQDVGSPGTNPSRHFRGTIAGLVFNGIHVLTLSSDGDPLINIRGDVDLEVRPLRPQQLASTPTPPSRRTQAFTPGMKTTLFEVKGSTTPSSTSTLNCSKTGSCSSNVTTLGPLSFNTTTSNAVITSGTASTIATVTSKRCGPDNVDDEDCGENPDRDDDDESNSSGVLPFGVFPPGHNSSASEILSMSSLPETQTTTVASQQQFPVSISGGSTAHPSSAARGASSKRSGIDTESGSNGEDPSSSPSTGRRSISGGNGSAGSNNQMVANVSLIAGVSVGVVVALLLAGLAVYKYRSRDEGSYRLDPDARNGYTGYRPCTVTGGVAAGRANESTLAPVVGDSSTLAVDCIDVDDGCGSRSRSGSGSTGCGAGGTIYRLRTFRSRPKGRRDVKEWYV